MPIFHDPDRPRSPEREQVPYQTPAARASEESIRTEFCEGPLLDTESSGRFEPDLLSRLHGLGIHNDCEAVSDRQELIDRLKRRQSPQWTPNRPIQLQNEPASPFTESPSAGLKGELNEGIDLLSSPAEIERPKSALHSGDFTQEPHIGQSPPRPPLTPYDYRFQRNPRQYGVSPEASWYTSPPTYGSFQSLRTTPGSPEAAEERYARSRAPSLNSSSSFVLKPPTSPLVHASNNSDLDAGTGSVGIPIERSKSPRRYSLPPGSVPDSRRPLPSIRREGSFPYQAHQPKRSISAAFSHISSLSPQPRPPPGSRRPSISSETSPLSHAPMVGSYEESILRGRMSTTPSKPLNFTAQIGVLGRGRCKPSLKCPAHVTVPFPAVFYSYGGGKAGSEDEPSPYVGLVDLENCMIKPPKKGAEKKTHASALRVKVAHDGDVAGLEDTRRYHIYNEDLPAVHTPKPPKKPSKAPPGGSYRIPEKGQLQIVIKNPNKTAVKLFLIPYDLESMEPGMKTFIRQRSYSAGPIIELSPNSQKHSQTLDKNDRRTLRYLIHLHICCTAKGHYYLYKSIRVVFANRVPDGKEKLQNEVQQPDPRYSAYKPGRDSGMGMGTSNAASALIADKALRRRSAGWPPNGHDPFRVPDDFDTIPARQSSVPSRDVGTPADIRPVPFQLEKLNGKALAGPGDTADVSSPSSSTLERPDQLAIGRKSPVDGEYGKLSRGENGYGGRMSPFPWSPEGGEGLLAKKLRGLDIHKDGDGADPA